MFEPGNHRGPARTYRPEHVVYLMILLRENRRMSRRSLAERMGIGEGTARSLVSFLTSKGMVWVSRRGVSLTDEGRGYVDGLNLLLVPLGVAGCGISLVAAVVKGVAGNVGDGLHPVFAAIRAGAEDVSVYRVEGGMVPVQRYAPDLGKDRDYDIPMAADGDAVAICGSLSPAGANLAAIAAGIGFMRSAQGECRWRRRTGNRVRNIHAADAGTSGTARARRGPTSARNADQRCGTGPGRSRIRATCAGTPGSPGPGRSRQNAPSAGRRNGGSRDTGCSV